MAGRCSLLALGAAWVAVLTAMAQSLEIRLSASDANEAVVSWGTTPGRQYTLWRALELPLAQSGQREGVGAWTAGGDFLSWPVRLVGLASFYWVEAGESAGSPYNPGWVGAVPIRNREVTYDERRSSTENGAVLKGVLLNLEPGDRLEIGAGTYSLEGFTALDRSGTAEAPIWIVAASGARVVMTRPDATQNIINVGVGGPVRYVCFRGLEFVGGSHGVRLYDCAELWIDRCRVHGTGDVGLSANARNTRRLYLTRNEIWDTGGTGEGMYLGANEGAVIMSESVIALNHVHDTRNGVSQGDGIEIKQGSWGNWIVGNLIHDCHYPCLLVYGTAGRPANIVERNVCYRSDDNTMQVKGECLVRNNLALAGAGSAFASQPHQGDPTGITVVQNTFVNAGTAVRLSSWELGTDMVFANNVCASRDGAALLATSSLTGVVYVGNVCSGSVSAGVEGFVRGKGLADFLDVTWDGSRREAHPAAGSVLLGAASDAYATELDLEGQPRSAPHTAGSLAR